MRGYFITTRNAGHGRIFALWNAYKITRTEWWHCPVCGTAVKLHASDKKVGCHVDGCENDGRVFLCRGKGSGLGHWHNPSQNASDQATARKKISK